MRYISILAIALVVCFGLTAQAGAVDIKIVSTSFDAGYNAATTYNDNFFSDDSIDSAENMGFGAEMKFQVGSIVNLSLGFNYAPMKVQELDKITAYTRTDFPYAQNHISRTSWYENLLHEDGSHVFDVASDYVYHMNYINMLVGVEIAPLQATKGLFNPFVGVGISPTKFNQKGYWITDVTGNFRDDDGNFIGNWHYEIRTHAATRNKHRGWIFNGFVWGGFDIRINDTFGFQVKGRYFRTIADNDRNRITGFYNINAGIVLYGI